MPEGAGAGRRGAMNAPSPLAPAGFPDLPSIGGLRMAVAAAGIKYRGRTDLWLAEVAQGSVAAGVFTLSRTASAPVEWCRAALGSGAARAVLVNSGNANAFTGATGASAVRASAGAVAARLRCAPRSVYVASTGVIGEPLPTERVEASMDALVADLGAAGWRESAQAIMTTDTFPKGAGARVGLDDAEIAVAGICKGSGMIEPDMATMLGFVFTDLAVAPGALQALLNSAVQDSFNAITVDGDTSTSDTVLLIATGAARNRAIDDADDPRAAEFGRVLETVMVDLATQVVRDGEGASKFITIEVSGARDDRAARVIAKAIANSPLVKTAIAGADANWGRVVMAVGKAGEAVRRERLGIRMGGVEIAADGRAVDGYDESRVAAHLRGREIHLAVSVGVGAGRARVWTCDLTEGYVRINADYRS